MTINFFHKIGMFLLTLCIVNTIQAQENGMKKLPDITVTTTTNVSKKVSDIFKATFKDAENPVWTRVNRDYLVEFITRDINNRVLFHRNGTIIYHIKYGSEKNLPREVRRLVKSNYVDENITRAMNVQEGGRDIWVVNMEDNKKYIIVRVEGGELEEVSNVNRSVASLQ